MNYFMTVMGTVRISVFITVLFSSLHFSLISYVPFILVSHKTQVIIYNIITFI